MVITIACPSCHSSFPADPAKIPEGGVKVRCSTCAHVFRVERPAPEAPAPAEDIGAPDVGATHAAEPPSMGSVEEPAGPESGEAGGWTDEPAPAGADETVWSDDASADEGRWTEPAAAAQAWPEPSATDEAWGESPASDEPQEAEPETGEAAWPDPAGAEQEWAEPAAADDAWAEPAASEDTWAESPATDGDWPEAGAGDEQPMEFGGAEAVPEPESFEAEAEAEADAGPVSWGGEAETAASGNGDVARDADGGQAPIKGFTLGRRDPSDKARRLARVLVSDMIMYNAERHQVALEQGTLAEDFEEEIDKSWKEFVDQVGPEMADGEGRGYWTQALNEILAKGRPLF